MGLVLFKYDPSVVSSLHLRGEDELGNGRSILWNLRRVLAVFKLPGVI